MAKHLAIASANSISLEILEPVGPQIIYAVYLYDANGLCIIKTLYQSSREFSFDNLPKGKYRARIFCKNAKKKKTWYQSAKRLWFGILPKGMNHAQRLRSIENQQSVSWGTEQIHVSKTSKDDQAQLLVSAILEGRETKNNLLELFEKYSACLPQALHSLRLAGQRYRIALDATTSLTHALFEILQQSSLTPVQSVFALNIMALLAPETFLRDKKSELEAYVNAAKDIPDADKKFSIGIIEYRVGNYFSAEEAFQSINADEVVRYHQSGARSYFSGRISDDFFKVEDHPIHVSRLATSEAEGIVLFSCDYGYFKSYFEKTFENLQKLRCAIHLHIILPDEVDIKEIEDIPQWKNVGISYEKENLEKRSTKNRRTYYAVVRYLVCARLLDLYSKPILVADIDINFEKPIDHIFKVIKDDEIALYFGRIDLPWLRIMAGFNLFGKSTKNSEFLVYVQNYIWHCLSSGKDGWLLDQVSLDAAYKKVSYRQKSNIKPIIDLLGFSPVQYSNRQESRTYALRAVASLNNKADT